MKGCLIKEHICKKNKDSLQWVHLVVYGKVVSLLVGRFCWILGVSCCVRCVCWVQDFSHTLKVFVAWNKKNKIKTFRSLQLISYKRYLEVISTRSMETIYLSQRAQVPGISWKRYPQLTGVSYICTIYIIYIYVLKLHL